MYVVQHGKLPLCACCQPVGSLEAGIWLLAGFENPWRGLTCSWFAGGLGTHMGSIGKQVPLPLCHHYVTSTGASASCSLLDP